MWSIFHLFTLPSSFSLSECSSIQREDARAPPGVSLLLLHPSPTQRRHSWKERRSATLFILWFPNWEQLMCVCSGMPRKSRTMKTNLDHLEMINSECSDISRWSWFRLAGQRHNWKAQDGETGEDVEPRYHHLLLRFSVNGPFSK